MRRLLLTFTAFLVLASPADAAWLWPVTGKVITPYRNGSDPYASGQHRGIDIAAPVGTPVRAAAGGEVRFAGTAGSSGLTISIRTADGYDTSYLHLSSLSVHAGTRVSTGDRVGAVGTTGTRSAVAPHLHFGVRDAGTRYAYHDPLAFLPPPPVAAPGPNPPAGVPAPAPEPRAPVAAPLRAPAPRGARAPLPRPVRAPRVSPAPSTAPRPLPIRRRAAHTFLQGNPRPSLASSPGERTAAHPLSGTGDAEPSRAGEGRLSRAPDPRHSPAGPHPAAIARQRSAGDHSRGGPDIGWAPASAGLLLAAAILGLAGDRGPQGGSRASRTRSRLAAGLRPLVGRR
jgi:hypothetical protein